MEIFQRRIQYPDLLEIPAPRLRELLEGKDEMNLDFARRLYTKLHIPADVILSLAA